MKEIEQVIEEFNRLHKANCKLLEIKDDTIIVLFSGHICFTCGTYDYFEDLAVLLSEKLNEQLNGDYIVYYKPKEKIKQTKRDIKVIFFQI